MKRKRNYSWFGNLPNAFLSLSAFLLVSLAVSSAAAQEIRITGNGTEILSDDVAPTPADHTDFGSIAQCDLTTITRTFTIENTGAAALNLSGTPVVQIFGSASFTVSAMPASTSIASGASLTFDITYDPISLGRHSANVIIYNNDSDEGTYLFKVKGSHGPLYGTANLPTRNYQQILASDFEIWNYFGASVDIDGDFAVIGATQRYTGTYTGIQEPGAAYVFQRIDNTWVQVAKLTPAGGTGQDEFGAVVGISGNTVVVGAREKDNVPDYEVGMAYVFTMPSTGWTDMTETAQLTASVRNDNDFFGYSVDISGDLIGVTAWGVDDLGPNAGMAYLFKKPAGGWVNMTETCRLHGSDTDFGDELDFIRICKDKSTIVLGANQKEGGGAAYVFERPLGGWVTMTETAKLSSSTSDLGQFFGAGADIQDDGSLITVTAPYRGDFQGSIYIYERPAGGWANMNESSELTGSFSFPTWSPNVASHITGGAIDGDFILGAARMITPHTPTVTNTGASIFYAKPAGGWVDMTEDATAEPYDGQNYSAYGTHAVDDGYALYGSSQWDRGGKGVEINTGSVYAYYVGGEMNVLGNGLSINNTDETPDLSDHTDFGEVAACSGGTVTRTFTITNTGRNNFDLTGTPYIQIEGSDAFTVTAQPTGNKVTPCNSYTFEVTYTPTGLGKHSALVVIPNDATQLPASGSGGNPFTFRVEGSSGAVYGVSNLPILETQKFISPDAGAINGFGEVAVDGNYAVVGAPGTYASIIGAAYVYKRTGATWTQVAKLTATDVDEFDEFVHDVAISGNTVVISGTNQDNRGAAYVYTMPVGGWVDMTEAAKLTASTTTFGDGLGSSVDISGNTIIIGDSDYQDAGTATGIAYIFERPYAGWIDMTETARLTASVAAGGDEFGTSVAIYDNVAVVGATSVNGEGRAYVFEEPAGGWADMTETATIVSSDIAAGNQFGFDVDIWKDDIIVSAQWATVSGNFAAGAVYVYEKPAGGWAVASTETAKLTSSSPTVFERLGTDITIEGDYIFAGTLGSGGIPAAAGAGSVYMFNKPTGAWLSASEDTRVFASDPEVGAELHTVGFSDGYALFGAPNKDETAGANAGAVYAFAPNGNEIFISGNSNEIVSGDITPSTTDDTDFGTLDLCTTPSTTHTFSITNTGRSTLNLTASPIVSIAGDPEFTVSLQPVSNALAACDVQTFEVTYTPTTVGPHTAIVTIQNDDTDEGTYTFTVSGAATVCGTPPTPTVSDEINIPPCIYAVGQSHESIRVWWCDAAEDETGYEIWRKSEFDTDFYRIAAVPAADTEEVTFFDNLDLEPDTRYAYWVVTVHHNQKSHPSDLAQDYTYPLAPEVSVQREACVNGSGELLAEGSHRSGKFRWYESETSEEFLSEEALFETEELTGAKTYWVTSLGQKYESTPRVPVTITPNALPTASITGDAIQYSCESSISLSAEAVEGVIYRWLRFGLSIGETTEPSFEVVEQGIYMLEVVNASGCAVRSDAVKVFLNAIPEAKIFQGESPVFCESGTLEAKPVDGAGYEWLKDGLTLGTGQSIAAEESGVYTLFVTRNGCTTETSSDVTVNSLGDVSLTAANTVICPGSSTELTASLIADAEYELLRNGRIEQRSAANTFTVTKPGAYTVRLISNNCEAVSEELFIERSEVLKTVLRQEGSVLIAEDSEGSRDFASVRWFLNNEELTAFAGQSEIVPTEEGVYRAEVIYESGCESTSNGIRYFPSGTTATEDEVSEAEFASLLYPNPATDQVTLRLGSSVKEAVVITLTDDLGRVLERRELPENSKISEITFSLKNHASGLYFIRLEGFTISLMKKFVKAD